MGENATHGSIKYGNTFFFLDESFCPSLFPSTSNVFSENDNSMKKDLIRWKEPIRNEEYYIGKLQFSNIFHLKQICSQKKSSHFSNKTFVLDSITIFCWNLYYQSCVSQAANKANNAWVWVSLLLNIKLLPSQKLYCE